MPVRKSKYVTAFPAVIGNASEFVEAKNMIAVYLLCSLAIGAVWYLSGMLVPKIEQEFFLTCFKGCRGGLLAVAICTFIAALVSCSGLPLAPDNSRGMMFVFFSIGLSMIGVPVGFLLGIAKGQTFTNDDEQQ